MGQCFVRSATIRGIEALPIRVEVSVGPGLPGISVVGLPDSTVQEARMRVRAAIRASGFTVPPHAIVVNLSPSSIRKTGSGLDLPIAAGILACTGQISASGIEGVTLVGELSLDGSVHGVRGMYAVAMMVARSGGTLVTGPIDENLSSLLGGAHGVVRNLADLAGKGPVPASIACRERRCRDDVGDAAADATFGTVADASCGAATPSRAEDFSDIASQDMAKRALQISAAGGHAILMMGPPGSGKTMLARRIVSIMPPLEEEEKVESALLHSVAGLDIDPILAGKRPFRAPHHSATSAGILGGGNPVTPGEISLAHNGVLFLDEIPEFGSRKLQLLRQPMEDRRVILARAEGTYSFPADFLLVGAANPCPCGYLGDPERPCTCTPAIIDTYRSKMGGPIMDRFDMMITVRRIDPGNVMDTGTGVSSATLRDGVMSAREFAAARRAEDALIELSEGREAKTVRECRMGAAARKHMELIAQRRHMSGRGIMKALSVARTIADIELSDCVGCDHIDEAIMYRGQDS